MLDLSDPLPMKLVGVGQANVFTRGACQKHDTLNDLRVAHDAILQQVVDHLDPLLSVKELARDDLQSLVLCLNFSELVICHNSCSTFSRSGWLASVFFSFFFFKYLLEVDCIWGVFLELVFINFIGNLLSLDCIRCSGIFWGLV